MIRKESTLETYRLPPPEPAPSLDPVSPAQDSPAPLAPSPLASSPKAASSAAAAPSKADAAADAEAVLPVQTNFGADTFVVIEKWESADALKAHAASAHMAAYGAKTRPMIASRVIHALSSV